MSARPAAGPSRMATAAARFSSTTGEAIGPQQHVVEADDLRPIGRSARCGFGVHGGNRCLQRVGPEPAATDSARSTSVTPFLDQRTIPPRSVLIRQQHELAIL